MDIVVDAYGEEERALSWYYYLEENLSFPFRARCMTVRSISPLQVGEEVEVVGTRACRAVITIAGDRE
jgi:Calcium binding